LAETSDSSSKLATESATPGAFRKLGKQPRSVVLFNCKHHVVLIKNPHRVKLAIRFLQIFSDSILTM